MTATVRATTFIAVVAGVAAGCTGNLETALQRLSEARALSSDLLVQFTKTADAGNRAVMADSDEASMMYAREAEEAMQAVQKDVDALAPILTALRYSDETGLLQDFGRQFGEYRTLSQRILGLAVEKTNLRAQRLSFGPAQQSADAFRDELEAIARSAEASDRWRIQALTAGAVAAVREIQAVQAPHIAEPSDEEMDRLETRMTDAEMRARRALQSLASVTPPGSRPQLTAATAAFDRFMGLNAEIIGLSRRNSDVQSLALSLGQKRMLTAKCEETLRALQNALAKRTFSGTR